MGRKKQYELRWTGNIKPNGQKELVWIKINKEGNQGFTPPNSNTNICGTCADDLRGEEDARIAQAQAEADEDARAEMEWEAQEAERLARDRY